jgi:hypothetical protein
MNNATFNLINQLTQEQKSLWRINEHYLPEAANDHEKELWESLKSTKEETIALLQKQVKEVM